MSNPNANAGANAANVVVPQPQIAVPMLPIVQGNAAPAPNAQIAALPG